MNLSKLKRIIRNEGRHGLVGGTPYAKEKGPFEIEFLKEKGLLPEHLLLDIGCGTLRGGIHWIRYLQPHHYAGLEVR